MNYMKDGQVICMNTIFRVMSGVINARCYGGGYFAWTNLISMAQQLPSPSPSPIYGGKWTIEWLVPVKWASKPLLL